MGPSDCLCIIPARLNSKRIPHKNFVPLAGLTPLDRAVLCAQQVFPANRIVVTTDGEWPLIGHPSFHVKVLKRPAMIARDTTEMIDTIKHVLQICPEGDPVVLLQPTQPLRTPVLVRKAVALLTPEMDSVVTIGLDRFVRDGTAYVFWRSTITLFGTIYGEQVVLMPVSAHETCPLDTPEQWVEAERRLKCAT